MKVVVVQGHLTMIQTKKTSTLGEVCQALNQNDQVIESEREATLHGYQL